MLVPPEPAPQAIADVGAAVRDAVRFPLSGSPLAGIVPRGGRATIVADVPSLPLPSAPVDARRAAIGAAVQELRNLGIPDERQTILVTAGLAATTRPPRARPAVRPGVRSGVLRPGRRPRRRGSGAGRARAPRGRRPLRVARELVDADVVVSVSAAETVVNGGPGVLLSCGGPTPCVHAEARSLLEPSGSPGWRAALARGGSPCSTRGAARHLPRPRPAEDRRHCVRLPLRRTGRRAHRRLAGGAALPLLPGVVRLRIIRSLPVAITAAGAFAGPPSVAHAEALLRSIDLRSIELDPPLDAICLGIPRTTPYLPRERPNPLLAAYLGLGLALRLWRESPPVVEGGTAILLHRFHRRFAHPTQQPYRAFFHATRGGLDPRARRRGGANGRRGSARAGPLSRRP